MEGLWIHEAVQENNGKQFRMRITGRGIQTSSIHVLVQWTIYCLLINNINTGIFCCTGIAQWKKHPTLQNWRYRLSGYGGGRSVEITLVIIWCSYCKQHLQQPEEMQLCHHSSDSWWQQWPQHRRDCTDHQVRGPACRNSNTATQKMKICNRENLDQLKRWPWPVVHMHLILIIWFVLALYYSDSNKIMWCLTQEIVYFKWNRYHWLQTFPKEFLNCWF